MALKDTQTQFITQAPDPTSGQLVSYIAASLRVYDVTSPTVPSEIGLLAMTLGPDAVLLISPVDSDVLFIMDGRAASSLFSVSVADLRAPVVLGSIGV